MRARVRLRVRVRVALWLFANDSHSKVVEGSIEDIFKHLAYLQTLDKYETFFAGTNKQCYYTRILDIHQNTILITIL